MSFFNPMTLSSFMPFYHSIIKPLLPRRLQIELRRKVIQAQRSMSRNIWPIDEKAGEAPVGWTGWPEKKRFALVLTHDVETEAGVAKCHKLSNMEQSRGFRSCFNFVPEDCKGAESLRPDLVSNGFEVGAHGLCHNGNLYSSRRKFTRKMPKINKYLKDWGSIGFRTPSMYHNLDWIGELDIEYDSSTFDTDPYEPQPDGAGTIFPFLVQTGSTSQGYVELPYTLPQDFTLFVLMKEKNIDIWKRKLEWIVEKGGMALLITHPDYMAMDGNKPKLEEYPAAYYEEFLDYITSRFGGQYWSALPKEVAQWWQKNYGDRLVGSFATCGPRSSICHSSGPGN